LPVGQQPGEWFELVIDRCFNGVNFAVFTLILHQNEKRKIIFGRKRKWPKPSYTYYHFRPQKREWNLVGLCCD